MKAKIIIAAMLAIATLALSSCRHGYKTVPCPRFNSISTIR